MRVILTLISAALQLGCANGDASAAFAGDEAARSAVASASADAVSESAPEQPTVAPETVTVMAGRTRVRYIAPVPPQKQVPARATPVLPAASKKLRVAAGDNLQATLDRAQPGDEVILARGAVFTGNFRLPKKRESADWIIVRSETEPTPAGVRIESGNLAGMPRLVSPNAEAAIRTAPGAARWRLVGFEVAQGSTGINYGLVVLGVGDETTLAAQPSQIVLDRMYVHGNATADLKRCVAFNGAYLAVIDSYLAECHGKGFDAQGIAGWNGPGPFLIENNRIEGSGQAILFGGADPRIANVSPSDITIRRNYLFKPMSWGGGRWSIKATFELKHGRRVLFEGNVLENHWADAQTGFAILFQTLSDNNTAWAWTTVGDVMVRNNIIKTSAAGVNILSRVAYDGGPLPTTPSARIALVNNLFQNVGRDPVSGAGGRIFQLLGDLHDMTVANNTVTLGAGSSTHAVIFDGTPQRGLVFVNNVLPPSEYGVLGSGKAPGVSTLDAFAPGAVFKGNVVPAQNGAGYPGDNVFPGSMKVFLAPDDAARRCAFLASWMASNRIPASTGVDCASLPGGSADRPVQEPERSQPGRNESDLEEQR